MIVRSFDYVFYCTNYIRDNIWQKHYLYNSIISKTYFDILDDFCLVDEIDNANDIKISENFVFVISLSLSLVNSI